MQNTVQEFALVGFSTGAGLALLQGARKGKIFKGIVSINAPIKLQNIASRFTSAVVMWNKMLDTFQIETGKKEFVENEPENPHINYYRNPINGVYQLKRLMDEVEECLEKVQIPTLIIQGSEDPVVNPESALEIFEKLGTDQKEIYRLHSKHHVIVQSEEHEKVFKRIHEFLYNIFFN